MALEAVDPARAARRRLVEPLARIVARSTRVDSSGRKRIHVDYRGAPVRFGGGPVKRGEIITWEAELPVWRILSMRSISRVN